MKGKRVIINIVILIILQFLVDMLYVILYPDVNPLRAVMIGISSFIVLWIFGKKLKVDMWIGGLSIFSSAFFGALLVQGGILVSKSVLSGVIHILILIVSYFVFRYFIKVGKE